jgi:hypothetical protein
MSYVETMALCLFVGVPLSAMVIVFFVVIIMD